MISRGRISALCCIIFAGPVVAEPLVFSPVNPSFGGNPLNSSHLLGLANAQRTATAGGSNSSSGSSTTTSSTNAELFVRQLESRLMSSLASQVTEAIFGENSQDSGTVKFGDTSVSFERTLDSIRLTITDATGVTDIVVPILVVN
jgi:curli production assembly/transport component CsgF